MWKGHKYEAHGPVTGPALARVSYGARTHTRSVSSVSYLSEGTTPSLLRRAQVDIQAVAL